MIAFKKSRQGLVEAFSHATTALLGEYIQMAGGDSTELLERLDMIGNIQRLMILERVEGAYDDIDDSGKRFLLEYYKRKDGRGEDWDLTAEQLVAIDAWTSASERERFVGFGIHSLIRPLYGADNEGMQVLLFRLAVEVLSYLNMPDEADIENRLKRANAKRASEAYHNSPNGSRAKRAQIRALWASGRFSSRDICAEQESAALGMSFSAARKALIGQPTPS